MTNQPSTGVGLDRVPLRIAGVYALSGLLWIWLSDWTLRWIGFTADDAFLANAIKGTAYVAFTAALLYWLVRREVAAARHTESLLRAVVEGTSDAVFVKRSDGRYLLANKAAAAFMGKPVDEILGFDDHAFFEAADAERLIANDTRVMAGGKVVTFEETIKASGVQRTYHATKAPFRDTTGAVVGLIGVSRDISDRKAIEDALRDSEKRYRELADAIPQIVWTASPDGAVTHLNSKAVEFTGLEAADLTGWSWERVIHPDDIAQAVAEWSLAIREGVPRPFEMRIRRVDGAYSWHFVRQLPICNATGGIDSWVGTCTDIEDLKQAAKALWDTQDRLREAQRIARLGSWTWEPQTDIVIWSDAEFELFGVDAKAVPPSFDVFLSLLHPDDRPIALARVESMRAGANEFANDMRIIRPDGSTIWIHSRARATRDAEGKVIRVEGTDQDITAGRLAELAAQESERQLQAAIEVAGLGSIAIDYNSQIADLSTRAAEHFGFIEATSIRRTELHARFHSDDRIEFERLTARAMDTDGTGWFARELRVIWPDGTMRWLNLRKQISFADGRPHQAIVVSLDISDQRQAEEALRTSESRYRLMFESNPHPMWVYDIDSLKFLAVNDSAVLAYGYTRDEFLAMSIRDIRPAEDVELLESTVSRIATGLTQSAIWRHRRKDGSVFHVDVSSHSLPDAGGRSRLVLALDVTNRLQAEEARDELLARLQMHIDLMPFAYVCFDADFNYSNWNPAAERIFGYSREEIIGQPVHVLVHPDDRTQVAVITERLRAGDMNACGVNRNVTKDGRTIICEWHNTPLFAADRTFLGVLSMTLDITNRVMAEEGLRESERRLRLALEAAGAIAFTWDINRDVVTRYFSTEPALPVTAESLGTLNDVRARIHSEDVANFDSRLAACLAEGSDYRNQYRVVRSDGSITPLEEYGCLDRAADGSPLCLNGISIDISDRVAATEALRLSEERLRIALQGARGGVWDWNLTSGEVWWSPEVYDLMGAAEGTDTREGPAIALICEDDRPKVMSAVADAIARKVDYHCEFRVMGGSRWLSSRARLSCNAAGDPVRLLGISWDISDRMNTMEALRESEERYRRLLSVLPTAVLVHNGERVLYSNPAFVRLVGVESAEEMLDRHPIDFVDPDDRPLVLARLSEMRDNGEPLAGQEVRLRRIDGRSVPTYSVSTPVTGYGSTAFLVAVSDMTERERATQLLRSVLRSVGDAILTIDERGVINSANPSALCQFGYTEDELVGKNLSVLMPSPHREEYDEYLAEYLRTKVTKVIGRGREVECLRSDGTQFPAELTVTEFYLDGERHFTGVLRDITERRRLQAQFIEAQKMEAVGRLAGGVAHDFNNLLTVINGYCDLLLMSDFSAGDNRRDSIATIRDAGERAARLTQQLLAFSRKAFVSPKLIDLNALVTDSLKLLRRLIGEDIVITAVTPPTPIQVNVDPSQLEQVVMNLVVNARDAMPTGGRLTIETSTVSNEAGDPSRFACLSVSDTGHGMSDEVKAKIFEPFFSTKGVGKGTGLGLSVVHGIVTQSGGRIAIESSIDVGSTFEIFLPLITDAKSIASGDPVRLDTRGSETILLVEDEENVRRITRISLQTQGYQVLESDGGAAAIRYAEEYPGDIHLLLSDVVMPEMGGRQLLNAVRQFRPGLRVLFMSGYTDDAVLRHGVVEATDAFIQKPFTPLSLAKKVREVIDGVEK